MLPGWLSNLEYPVMFEASKKAFKHRVGQAEGFYAANCFFIRTAGIA